MYVSPTVLLTTACIKSFNSTHTAMILNTANFFIFTEKEMVEIIMN